MINRGLSQQQGMTLLEVLIATAILTIISALAFLSIDNMVKAKTTLNEHTEQLNLANLTYFLLQNDLQFAVSSQQSGIAEAEFVGNAQDFTLIRFKGQTATSSRISQSNKQLNQPLQKVRWYINDQHLTRAVMSAHEVGYGQSWQQRQLLKVKTFSCAYQNAAGNFDNQWPKQAHETALLPKSIQCLITTADDGVTEFNVTPWQQIW